VRSHRSEGRRRNAGDPTRRKRQEDVFERNGEVAALTQDDSLDCEGRVGRPAPSRPVPSSGRNIGSLGSAISTRSAARVGTHPIR